MESLLAGKRVLVVEDEGLVAELVVDILGDLAAGDAVVAACVDEALARVAGEAWDLAILDLNLRGESGWPVVAALKRRGVPCLVVSGCDVEELHADPDLHVLCKPYSVAEFIGAVRALDAGGWQAASVPAPVLGLGRSSR